MFCRLFFAQQGDDNLPALATWYQAYLYAAWLGARLPTEAEWEYACRAGTETRYWSGDSEEDLMRVAFYQRNSGGQLHKVKRKPANPWGLYDMHGNIWEWVADCYGPYLSGAQSDPTGPTARRPGAPRVLRGGACYDEPAFLRSAVRDRGLPGSGRQVIGMRCVLPEGSP